MLLYPLIVRPFYPSNVKNDVSKKLCDESQQISFVWYRQCTFFIETVFIHVYKSRYSRNIFHHFLTAYICTQIKIKRHIIIFHDMNNISVIIKLRHIILEANWRYKDVMVPGVVQTDNTRFVRYALDCVYIQ